MTSSPAPGLPVVAFFTIPVRVWAEARVESRKRPMSETRKVASRLLRRKKRVASRWLPRDPSCRKGRGPQDDKLW